MMDVINVIMKNNGRKIRGKKQNRSRTKKRRKRNKKTK